MSLAVATRSRGAGRATRIATLAVATLLAAAAGAVLGGVVAPAPSEPQIAPAEPRTALRSGVATVPLPAGWRPLGCLSSLPGLEEATAVQGVHSEVALDIRPPEHASLLPERVEDAAGGLPEPRPLRLGSRTAWRYELPGPRGDVRVAALALPTTEGVVTIACAAGAGAIALAGAECEQAARAMRLDGASALTPAPETAAAIVLPDTVAQLNRRRRTDRRRLAATRSPALRSAAALRLARGYAGAAARLRPLAAGDALRLTAALDALAAQHRALAGASRRLDAEAARRAGAAIERNERRLGSLLAAVTGPAVGR